MSDQPKTPSEMSRIIKPGEENQSRKPPSMEEIMMTAISEVVEKGAIVKLKFMGRSKLGVDKPVAVMVLPYVQPQKPADKGVVQTTPAVPEKKIEGIQS